MNDTQPSLLEIWMKVVWRRLNDLEELVVSLAQENQDLRQSIKRLEARDEELDDTQRLE
jgi:hypothetical protein